MIVQLNNTMKTFGNLNHRQAGILLPISCLPGPHGIGDLGQCAYDFIDITHQAGFRIWQILPLNPSSDENSPYTPYSSFAGDEIYISLDLLLKWGLLESIDPLEYSHHHIQYDKVRQYKHQYLQKAYHQFKVNPIFLNEYHEFLKHAYWLDDYAQFMALNNKNNHTLWITWSKQDQDHPDYTELSDEIEYIKFIQFIFIKQFYLLKEYAHRHHISIMGDMPIYVGLDSSDVYHHRQCFLLNEDYTPQYISGASPDYFSDDGQLWNHPIYDWDYLKKTDYKFWVDRLKWNNAIFDILRIDHFRAFDTYWRVPYGEKTARNGEWILGPSYDFFDSIYRQLPDLNLIVEDLGDLREEVGQLRDLYHLLGMRIIQYSFGENEEKEDFAIHEHCVAYSGTHDNSPLVGWYDSLREDEKIRIENIMKRWNYQGTIPQQVLERTFDCKARIAIVMLQDILDYDETTRLNFPGTQGDPNWCWKLIELDSYRSQISRIQKLLKNTNRL